MAKKKGPLASPFVPAEEQPYPIPENWCWTRLKVLVEASKEKTNDFSNGDTKYVGLEHIEKDGGIIGYSSATEVKSLKAIFHVGQILYGKLRPYLNKHDIAGFEGVCSTDILVFDTKNCADSRYVNYFFNQRYFIEYAVSNSKGINLPRVSESIILEAICPLPPLTEQRRIVDRIESLFVKLDEAKEKAQAVVDGFELRKSAILHKAFTGELTEQWRKEHGVCRESWSITPLGELTEIQSSKRIYKEEYVEAGIPFFRSSEVVELNDFGYTEPQFFISSSRYEEIKLQYGVPEQGDLLVTSVGTIGKTWIVDNRPFYYKDGNLTQVKQCSALNMKYLQFYIQSEGFKEQIRNSVAGSAYNALTIVKFKKIEIPVPSREEQSAIVGALDRVFTQERQAKEAAEAVLTQIDTMKKAILARAFRGELGTNDPAEEWAGELVKTVI